MARTVRLGDCYVGIDKMDHFLGFGRRYYSQYLRVRSEGQTEDEAVKTVINRGLFLESSMVGGVVDGKLVHRPAEAPKLLAHEPCGTNGNMGEGMSLQVTKDGRRIMWMAHESAPANFTGVDVSDPRKPKMIIQAELPHRQVRSNSLEVCGDIMCVAYQTSQVGLKPAGFELFDISTPEKPKSISMFDCSGPHSRGAHQVWFVDGEFVHFAAGAPDFEPLQWRTWAGLLFNGIFGTGIAYFIWFNIIGRLTTVMASLGSLINPVVGVIGAAILLGDRPTWPDMIGFALIFSAAACVLLPQRVKPAIPVPPTAGSG